MPSEMFWVFQKKKLIYNEECKTDKKMESVKNVTIKKSATKVFQVCIILGYSNFILELSLSS